MRIRVSIIAAAAALACLVAVPAAAEAQTATVSSSSGTITVTPIDDASCDEGLVTIDVAGNEYEFVAAASPGGACGDIDPGGGCTDQGLEAVCPTAGVTQFVIGADPDGQIINVDDSEAPVSFDFNGGVGADVIGPGVNGDSMPGADTLDGGDGDDTLLGGDGGDTINGQDDNDDIDGGDGADVIDAGNDADGSVVGDDIQGGAGVDQVSGGSDSSADELKGGNDGDALNGGGGSDDLFGDAGVDTVNGDGDDDDLRGGLGNDTLNGGDGDDLLNGEDGADTYNGGDGVENGGGDTATYTGRADPVIVTIGGGANDGNANVDDANSAAPFVAADNLNSPQIENVTGGNGADTLTGDANSNGLDGGAGDDDLFGGTGAIADGADSFTGGTGDDRVSYAARTGDLVLTADGTANDTDGDNIGTTVEDISGGSGDDDITGTGTVLSAGVSRDLNGGDGDDFIIVSTTAVEDGNDDEFIGGAHGTAGGANGTLGDTVSYQNRDSSSDVVVDIGGGQNDGAGGCPAGAGCEDDEVSSSVENLTGGDGDDSLVGNGVANTLLGGNGGSDTLAGGAQPGPDGADVFSGGQNVVGTLDAVTYAVRTDNLSVDIDDVADDGGGDGDNVGNSIEILTGGSGSDTLTALGADNDLRGGPGTGNDALSGGAGDDILRGGEISTPTGPDGADTYNGGEGTENDGGDLVTYGPRDDNLVIDIGGGADDSDGDNVGTDVENLQGGDGDDTITGDAQNNELIGDVGSDLLAGGATDAPDGDDILDGRSGTGTSDTVSYAHRSAGLFIDFESGTTVDGTDTDTLLSNENAIGGGAQDTLVGNDSDNTLDGRGGDDFLNGGFADTDEADGADTYIGGETGESDGDFVNYGHRAATVTADIGAALDQDGDEIRGDVENLIGGQGNDTLAGDGRSNQVEGIDGDDTITGGGAVDSVTGGDGDDIFNVRDGLSDNVDCGADSDGVAADLSPAEIFASVPACELINAVTPQQADLSLTKTASNPNPTIGQQVTFTLTLTSAAGASPANGVHVADVLPAGLTHVSDVASQGSYDQTTGDWNIGAVAAGSVKTLSIVVTVNGPLPITNTAEISSMQQDDVDPDSTPNNGTAGEDDLGAATLGAIQPPPPGGGGGGGAGAAATPLPGPAPAAVLKKCKKGQKLKQGKCVKKKRKKRR